MLYCLKRYDHVALCATKINEQAFARADTQALLDEEYFAVDGRGHVEIKHRLGPVLHLGAGHHVALGPCL